jgi:hypothetical protein
MKKQTQTPQAQKAPVVQGFIADAKVYLNEDRGTLTHRLPDNMRIEMPVNLYKKILGLPFEKKEEAQDQKDSGPRSSTFGLVARPVIYLTKDGQYLIHRVLGIRVSKHVNYYRQIFKAEFIPKTQSQALPA